MNNAHAALHIEPIGILVHACCATIGLERKTCRGMYNNVNSLRYICTVLYRIECKTNRYV